VVGVVVVVVLVFRRAMYGRGVRDCCRWWYRLVVDMLVVVAVVAVLCRTIVAVRCCW